MTSDRNDIMVTCRIPRDDVEYIDGLAAEAGCSRSEYIRRVLKLPVAMQAEGTATLRTSRGDRRVGTVARESDDTIAHDANATPVSDCDATQTPRAVLLLTDVPIRKLCVAIDRWGTNYNQAVRALNAIAKRFSDMPLVNRDDANDILYFLQVCAQGNEQAKKGIDSVAEEARQLLGVATIDMRTCKPRKRSSPSAARSRRPRSGGGEQSGSNGAASSDRATTVGEYEDEERHALR